MWDRSSTSPSALRCWHSPPTSRYCVVSAPARAGYTTVLFPIVALAVSTAVEGYVWTPLAAIGVVFAIIGNVLVMRRPTAKA